MKRRKFLESAASAGLLYSLGKFPTNILTDDEDLVKITILHTNDVHSRVDPFPMDGGRNQGRGGVSARANLVKKIRRTEKNVLLFDAGDIFQGTPYFNMFKGEVEMKAMSAMGYDAGTIGNHDFDEGLENLKKQTVNHANFPLLCTNYDFSDTTMNGVTQEYKVFVKDGVKIGVFGVGIELEGLVTKNLYLETRYLDPISNANRVASLLKNDLKCDYVVCLSHLGYKYDEKYLISDQTLAKESTDIDLIIGGHTHTFLDNAVVKKNKNGRPISVNQVGFAGLYLGRLNLHFERNKKGKCVSCKNTLV